MPAFDDFDFDLARAVQEQLVDAFKNLTIGKLDPKEIADVAERGGVYLLFLDGVMVYIGKADGDLRSRLTRHYEFLAGRKNLDHAKLGFKALYVHRNYAAQTHEESLLKYYRGQSAWNNSGIGSNDPGRNRDTTDAPDDHFDVLYPIDEGYKTGLKAGEYGIFELLNKLKADAPFIVRFQLAKKGARAQGHPDYLGKKVTLTSDGMTAGEILTLIAKALPEGWYADTIAGKMILYKERKTYPRGKRLWPLE